VNSGRGVGRRGNDVDGASSGDEEDEDTGAKAVFDEGGDMRTSPEAGLDSTKLWAISVPEPRETMTGAKGMAASRMCWRSSAMQRVSGWRWMEDEACAPLSK
jgi:hypothetical protein